MAGEIYGPGSGRALYTKTPSMLRKNGLRVEDAVQPNHGTDTYKDTYIQRTRDGYFRMHVTAPGKEMYEERHPSGTGRMIMPDGSEEHSVTGDRRSYVKGNQTSTVDGNSDDKKVGHSRTNTTGGSHSEVKGDSSMYVSGAGAAHYGSGYAARVSNGVYGVSATDGVSMGVGQEGKQTVQTKMEKDGTYRVTVTPNGTSDSGNYELKISPNGDVELKTKGSITYTADGDMTFKAKGNITVDSGKAFSAKGATEADVKVNDVGFYTDGTDTVISRTGKAIVGVTQLKLKSASNVLPPTEFK